MSRKIVLIIGVFLYTYIQAQNTNAVQDSIAFHQSFISESFSEDNSIITRSTATTNQGSFSLSGNVDTYYPVVFLDKGWSSHEATIIEIGRSNVHENSSWNGSLIASFRFHVTRWGHGSNFVDVDLKQNHLNKKYFVGGWQDITGQNNNLYLIIWLRGAATYYYHSNYSQSPIYTSSNVTVDGKSYAPKNQKDDYVNITGATLNENLWVLGDNNYFQGNVGIGTNNPQSKLDVVGTIRADKGIIGQKVSTDPGEITRLALAPYKFTGGIWNFNSRDTSSDAFLDINYGINKNLITIQYTGNIGIGTATPKNKLDVVGTIRATEVKVETGWADFVFDKDYKLPSLEEVESHINEYKRLPDIPSEAQIKEEGVGLGEMQVKLLQKIEELTLYIIDLKKENQGQSQRIEELEKSNKR